MQGIRDDQFVQLLTACQLRLFAYIVALVPGVDAANDVLQDTNAELWSKRAEFQADSQFGAWACKIAHFKVLSYYRDRQRDRHVFDDTLLDDLAARAESQTAESNPAVCWLDECLAELPVVRRTAILDRYRPGNSVEGLAKVQSKSPGAVSKALARTRALLLACLNRKKKEAVAK